MGTNDIMWEDEYQLFEVFEHFEYLYSFDGKHHNILINENHANVCHTLFD